MGRHAKDPELFGLANKLKDSPFTQYVALNDEIEDIWKANELRNVYLMKDGKTFAVKLWIAGAARIIGYTFNLADAARFADLARWHFAKYRVRDAREPVDSDLNFPVAQVKNDLEHEPSAMALIREVEHYLKEVNAISEGAQPVTAQREKRQTVRDDLNYRFAAVEDQFDALAEMVRMQIKQVTTQLTRIEEALASFKHNRISASRIDIVDAEVVESKKIEENPATMKEPLKPVVVPAAFEQGFTGVISPNEGCEGVLSDIFTAPPTNTNPTNP